MRRSVPAAVFALLFAAACGKVGDPKPPINRTPQSVGDLKASQSGYSLTLVWTNPARYIDNNEATDLAFVRILRNGVPVANEKAGPAGQPQSFVVDVTDSLERDLTFAVQVETQRGRTSTLSNALPIRPVDVPGIPRNLVALVDQRRIFLTWEPPERNRDLAQGYHVQRSDWPAPLAVTTTRFDDADYEPDKTYEYKVTAARGSIPGASSVSVSVVAKDEKAPAIPTGLQIESIGTGIVALKWNANTERDFKEFLIYRSDQTEPIFRRSIDSVTDTMYRPGLSYQLEAWDESGNHSLKSAPQAGP